MAFTRIRGTGITTTDNYQVGVITASKFVGPMDGGIGSGTNFVGVITATGLDINGNADVSGNLDVGGNLSVGGTVTYQDVTNVDSIGVGTFQSNVQVGAGISVVGVSTFTGDIDANADIELAGNLAVTGLSTFTGISKFDGDIDANADIELAGNLAVTGVSTFTGAIDANGALDVDGQTDLDVTRISQGLHVTAGISTFEDDIDANADIEVAGNLNVTGIITGGSFSGIDSDKISEGNTEVETVDTGSDGHIKFTTEGTERARIDSAGITTFGSHIQMAPLAELRCNDGDGKDWKIYTQNDWLKIEGVTSGSKIDIRSKSDGLFLGDNGQQVIHMYGGSGGGIYFKWNNDTKLKLENGNWAFLDSTDVTFASGGTVTHVEEIISPQDYPNFRPTLDFNFAAVKKLDSIIEYRRTGPASYIDDLGLVKSVGPNTPRFDHDPVTKECKGLLVEEIRTNHQSYSEEISRATNSNVTITNNIAISPDGTQNASRIVGSGSDSNTNIHWSTQTVATGHFTTWSIFVKSEETSCILQFYTNTYVGGNARLNVELADGTTGGDAVNGNTWFWKVEEYPNSWWRVSWGGTGANAAGNMRINVVPSKTSARDATSGSAVNKTYYAWGVQEEHGAAHNYATSYIHTYGKTATRGADIVTIEGEEFTDFYNQKEGTLVLSASYTEDIRTSASVVIDDTSNESEYTEIGYRAGGGGSGSVASYTRTDAGNDQYYKNYASSATQGNEFKVAFAYKDNDYASSVNGQTVDTDTSGTTSKVFDRLRFSDVDTVGVVGSGYYRRFIYYSKRLPNNQVVTLTS